VNWLLNTTILEHPCLSADGLRGRAAVIGYDFVGPRVEIEGVYRNNQLNFGFPGRAISNQVGQLGIMANLLYDFSPAFDDHAVYRRRGRRRLRRRQSSLGSTSSPIRASSAWAGTSTPTSASTSMAATTARPTRASAAQLDQQQLQHHAGLQIKFGAAAPPPPPPARRLRRRRSWCSSIGTARTCRPRR
jgi:hypothetical protein